MTNARGFCVRSARKAAPAALAAVLGARLALRLLQPRPLPPLQRAELAALAEELAEELAAAREIRGTSPMSAR